MASTQSPDLARTVAVASLKGGVGKTTLSSAVASEAARLGAKVLVIDADSQSSLTTSQFGLPDTGLRTVGDVIVDGTPGAAATALLAAPDEWQPAEGLPWERGGALAPDGAIAVIPGNPGLDAAITEVSTKPRAEDRLANALRGIADQFDLVLIDSGPNSDRRAWTITLAAGHVVVPTFAEAPSVDGLDKTVQFLDEFARMAHPDLRLMGTVVSRYNAQKHQIMGEVMQDMRAYLADPGIDVSAPPFTPVTHSGIDGVVPDTTTGFVLFPEVIPDASYLMSAHKDRLPVHHGLIPRDGEDPDPAALAFFRRAQLASTRAIVLRYTRLALRVLLATGSPALPRIAEAMSDRPIDGLWDEVGLTGDGTGLPRAKDAASTDGGTK